jgi:hypothetical protein
MGSFEGMREGSYNGCSWIATYNALQHLGATQQPSKIVEYYETNGGTLINGIFGVNPGGIRMFFNDHGFDTEMFNFPRKGSVDARIQDSDVSILTYWHGRGAHTVAVVRKDDGKFYVYNEGNQDTRANGYTSIDAWIRGEGREGDAHILISVITVNG